MALLQIENIVTARFVTLVNDGFNDDILQAGANQSVISGWSNSGAFVFHPTANLLPDLPDSPNVLVLQSQARVTQLVLADVLAGETITFSISMTVFNSTPGAFPATLAILSGENLQELLKEQLVISSDVIPEKFKRFSVFHQAQEDMNTFAIEVRTSSSVPDSQLILDAAHLRTGAPPVECSIPIPEGTVVASQCFAAFSDFESCTRWERALQAFTAEAKGHIINTQCLLQSFPGYRVRFFEGCGSTLSAVSGIPCENTEAICLDNSFLVLPNLINCDCFWQSLTARMCEFDWARSLANISSISSVGCLSDIGFHTAAFQSSEDCEAARRTILDAVSCTEAILNCISFSSQFILESSDDTCECVLQIDKEIQCFLDPCLDNNPCLNGGTCVTDRTCTEKDRNDYCFTCDCLADFSGPLCQEDADACEIDNGGCEDYCFDGAGAHFCQCQNAPASSNGTCTQFCTLMHTIFPDRIVYCNDLNGIMSLEDEPKFSTSPINSESIKLFISSRTERKGYLFFENACGDTFTVTGPFDCEGGCYLSFDLHIGIGTSRDSNLHVMIQSANGNYLLTGTSAIGTSSSFRETGHPNGVWKRVVLPQINQTFDSILLRITDLEACNSDIRVDDILLAKA
eukprot:gene7045-417_t